jgi:cysteinyl-tRNA synthetase
VLWKESRDDEPGWNAEFRLSRANADELKLNSVVISIRGRPGWHIECSVMSKAHLGEVFDIHGGGLDLIFPHHENEIAQSRCAHGTPVMANYWLHNGFLQVEGQKMSKSLGNFTTIADVLKDWPGEVARFNMLKTHYRQPIDWTTKGLEEAEKKLFQWSTWALDYEIIASADPHWATPTSELLHSLYDDLNLPNAFAYLDQLSSGAYNEKASAEALFRNACFLGLLNPQKLFVHQKISVAEGKGLAAKAYKDNRLIKVAVANNDWAAVEAIKSMLREKNIHVDVKTNGEVHFQSSSDDDSKIRKLIDIRNEARMAKNWVESDRIRDELAAMGIQIKDNKDGTTTWEVKR